jgi:drug/metabolite transporter (DMT)-like permease
VDRTGTVPTRTWLPVWLALAIIWGSSFLLIKYALVDFSPLEVAAGRIVLGALAVLTFVVVRRQRLPTDWWAWVHGAIVGTFLCTLPFLLFAWAETRISSLLAGLFNAGTPLFTALAGLMIARNDRIGSNRTLGLGIGLAGVLVILGVWNGAGGTLAGSLAAIGATVCYGVGIQWTRQFLTDRTESAESLVAVQLIVAAACLSVAEVLLATAVPRPSGSGLLALAALGVLGTGVAFLLNYRVIRIAGALTSSTVTYATPVVSTLLAILVLGESFSWNQPAGALLVLLGVALVQGFVRVFTNDQPVSVAPSSPADSGDVSST